MALNINGTTGISGVDGSASAPALQGTDSNTGINFGSDTVNINTGGSTRATVDSSGHLLVNTSSVGGGSYDQLSVAGGIKITDDSNSKFEIGRYSSGAPNSYIKIGSNSNSLRITNSADSADRLTLSDNGEITNTTTKTQGQTFVTLTGSGTSNFSVMVFGSNDGGHNTGSCSVALGKASNTGRSLNAAGTINASGSDYAEYMTKSGDFTLAKGDICGIDANGKLTNKFSESISFVVKSTDPSYVGGDGWGTQGILGEKPDDDSNDLPAYEEKYEAARKMVDRIAFSGQVPVNVTGATAGQHIIPTEGSGDSITGVAKAEKDLSMAEYMSSVGKVITLESDGRARIIVKVC